uniref:Unconventional myosin-XV-like n=1 Tax=Saccoglossus kowalevskii TaxID=10224 RepID=A0ABM0MDR1_SACKO|nr:PREDICTED: unconventional myosin-XV-like [Saccoglossus kowalevskii]
MVHDEALERIQEQQEKTHQEALSILKLNRQVQNEDNLEIKNKIVQFSPVSSPISEDSYKVSDETNSTLQSSSSSSSNTTDYHSNVYPSNKTDEYIIPVKPQPNSQTLKPYISDDCGKETFSLPEVNNVSNVYHPIPQRTHVINGGKQYQHNQNGEILIHAENGTGIKQPRKQQLIGDKERLIELDEAAKTNIGSPPLQQNGTGIEQADDRRPSVKQLIAEKENQSVPEYSKLHSQVTLHTSDRNKAASEALLVTEMDGIINSRSHNDDIFYSDDTDSDHLYQDYDSPLYQQRLHEAYFLKKRKLKKQDWEAKTKKHESKTYFKLKRHDNDVVENKAKAKKQKHVGQVVEEEKNVTVYADTVLPKCSFFPKVEVVEMRKPQEHHVIEIKKQKQLEQSVSEMMHNGDDLEHADGKYSMIEFAMKYFRESLEKYEMQRKSDGSISGSLRFIGTLKSTLKGGKKRPIQNGGSWTWQEYANMVKYTKSPIPASLLKLEGGQLNKLALECFIALMKLMGDYPMKGKTELECVYYILRACHDNEQLIDEVYCHLCNKHHDSCLRGWRFFAIFTSYSQCTSLLKPYLVKYLQTAANDNERQFHGTAAVCLHNLRKTFKYGGRKHIPGALEVKAMLAGRNQKRQQYVLPGGIRTMLKTKTCTVAVDVVEELCYEMGVHKQASIEEYGIFAVVEKENLVLPMNPGDYIIDVTTQLERTNLEHYLIFKKVLWYQPLRMDNPLNVTIIYNQVLPDFLSGRLLVMQNGVLTTEQQNEVTRLAALQRKASDNTQMPTTRDLRGILPSVVINQLKPQQWVNMIHQYLTTVERLTPHECKVDFLTTVSSWPLFGSNFFHIRSISDSHIQGECIMAINKEGVHFLHSVTHEILVSNPFTEIVSTRRLKSGQGKWFIDLKCGNLMVQKVTRIETDQGTEISNIISQYIHAQVVGKYKQPPVAEYQDTAGLNGVRSKPLYS